MTAVWRVRVAVLMLAAGYGVHQTQALLSHRAHTHAESHGYLTLAGPLVVVLLLLAVAEFSSRLRTTRAPSALPRTRTLWAAATGGLLALFGVQEGLEALAAHGHIQHVHEVVALDGWPVLLLAMAAGAAVALLVRGAASLIRWVQRRGGARPRAAAVLRAPAAPALAPRGSVLARLHAGRAPPALV